jgi:hypothetical protein
MINLLIDVLAVARLTRLVVEDQLTQPLRDVIDGNYQESRVAYLVHCPRCMSVWAGLAVVLLSRSRYSAPRGMVRMLALSEATIALRRLLDE